ncbi:putative reverse transcriptase domain-containing protein [Tanacetum coccineum]|uniref:Reverse transcriptase domain-containing protein n=1 Tax=Tanacetum coccineum TaxID=301880 RepID=A0ABQ5EEE1_9ASTR
MTPLCVKKSNSTHSEGVQWSLKIFIRRRLSWRTLIILRANEVNSEVNPVVPEPNQVVDIHDPNEMVDIPDDIDLVDYDEEDPEEDPEEEPEEDVDIEIEDDAELIFPYEVEGDKTPPPGDVSSDSVSSDSESEDEEVDVAPEATVGTITQKPYAIRDFLRGLFEVGEWDRGTFRATIMPPKAMSEARMREIIRDQVNASMAEFVANMNRGAGGAGAGGARAGDAGAGGAGVGGAGPAAPEITGCTYMTFMKCDPHPFKGTEGAVGLCQWFEKLESVFRISDCKEKDKVKFATATLQGRALTWWNGRTASMGIDAANGTPWTEVRQWMTEEFCPRSVLQRLEQELYNLKLKGTDIDGYTNRFHELALLYPRMVEPKQVKVEQYIRGLLKDITRLNEVSKVRKRKGEGDRGGRGDNRRDYNRWQNQRRANARAMTNVAPNDNEVCPKCKNKKHAGIVFEMWVTRKERLALSYKKNRQGGNNRGVYLQVGICGCLSRIRKVVTVIELEVFDKIINWDGLAITRYDAAILCGEKKVRIPLEAQKYIDKGCDLFLAQVAEQETKDKRLEDVPVIQD